MVPVPHANLARGLTGGGRGQMWLGIYSGPVHRSLALLLLPASDLLGGGCMPDRRRLGKRINQPSASPQKRRRPSLEKRNDQGMSSLGRSVEFPCLEGLAMLTVAP